MIELHTVTDEAGRVISDELLASAETVHRQLRPNLPADYASTMRAIFDFGGRMTMAIQDGQVVGVAVWRLMLKTVGGLELYVDDLITDEQQRSTGVGSTLLHWLEGEARRRGCAVLSLDSGTQRHRAHRFYFREGMAATSFHFVKSLKAAQ